MKLTAEREKLLTPLQAVIGVVERRQTMPVLANVLLSVRQGRLTLNATDLEVELVSATEVGAQTAGDITVPGRKLLDILRALPEKMPLSLNVEGEKVVIKAGRSRFSLSTLPAGDFPVVEDIHAQQSVQMPRKGVLELQRVLSDEGVAEIPIGTNHVRAQIGDIRFTSKLIDGRFPEYSRVIPAAPATAIRADRDVLRQALQRTAILSNEKYRGIRVSVKANLLTVQAQNPEQEEAEEEIEVTYGGGDLEVGFNVNYLLDALAAIDGLEVELGLTDSNSSCLIRSPGNAGARYVVMPMRL